MRRRAVHQMRMLILGAALVIPFTSLPAAAAAPSPFILVLHSYHPARWTADIMEGIESVFPPDGGFDLSVEYMDTKTLNTRAYIETLAGIYRLKYRERAFDLLLTSDDNAFRFALDHQADIFKGAPIVFCGVNRFDRLLLEGHPAVTGVVEAGDFRDTLAAARRLVPGDGPILVICDRTTTGMINLEGFRSVMRSHFPATRYEVLQDLRLDRLGERLAGAPADSFAFFISFWHDVDGAPVQPGDLEAVFSRSAVPVFGRSEWMLGRGLTGGKVVHGFSQGRTAAILGARILAGEPVSSLPVVTDSPNKFIFDFREMQRHGLPLDGLPALAEVINRPPPFYAVKRSIALSLIVAFLLLLLGTAVLVVAVSRARGSERRYRESEERYRSLVNNIDLGITLVDRDYRVVMSNAAQGRLASTPPADLPGRPCYAVFSGAPDICPGCPGTEAMKTGRPAVVEKSGDGDPRRPEAVRIHAFPVSGRDGQTAGFIEVVEDISAQRRDEENLRRAYEILEEKNRELLKLDRMKDALIGDVSHELKTPVAKHLMYLEVLKSLLAPGGGEAVRVIDAMEESIKRQKSVIRNILTLSRLEAGGRSPQSKPVRLDRLVREVVDGYRDLAAAHGVSLECRTGQIEILSDDEMLWHVFANLVDNAIKYRAPDAPRIDVTAARGPGGVTVTVADNGVGLSPEERERAFERFYQSTPAGEGIGLGLHICRRILDSLGGEITLSSDGQDRGTVARVTLPTGRDRAPGTTL